MVDVAGTKKEEIFIFTGEAEERGREKGDMVWMYVFAGLEDGWGVAEVVLAVAGLVKPGEAEVTALMVANKIIERNRPMSKAWNYLPYGCLLR
ncbi:hypothetical protein SRHO_G00227230 [Serrasalmus rhombeus]